MTVTVNATGSKLYSTPAGTTFDYTGLTVAAGSNSALVGLWMVDNNAVSPTGITAIWDPGGANQSLQLIASTAPNGQNFIFGYAGESGALATGNKILRVSWTGAVKSFFAAVAFDVVNQTGGATSFPNAASATTATVTITSATGNKVIACESSGSGQGASTGTLIFDDHLSGAVINAMCQYDNGAATVAIGNNGANFHVTGCDILAAAAAGGTVVPLYMHRAQQGLN